MNKTIAAEIFAADQKLLGRVLMTFDNFAGFYPNSPAPASCALRADDVAALGIDRETYIYVRGTPEEEAAREQEQMEEKRRREILDELTDPDPNRAPLGRTNMDDKLGLERYCDRCNQPKPVLAAYLKSTEICNECMDYLAKEPGLVLGTGRKKHTAPAVS